jgi:hypothetical protein
MTAVRALLLLTLLAACDSEVKVYTQEVHVRLRRDSCNDADLGNNVSCLHVKLQRQGSALNFSDTQPVSYLNTLEDLEKNYLRPIEHVTPGTWDLRIAGFSQFCNSSPDPLKAFFCGEVTNLVLPPLSGMIDVFVNCRSNLMTEELMAKIKNCSTQLLFGEKP